MHHERASHRIHSHADQVASITSGCEQARFSSVSHGGDAGAGNAGAARGGYRRLRPVRAAWARVAWAPSTRPRGRVQVRRAPRSFVVLQPKLALSFYRFSRFGYGFTTVHLHAPRVTSSVTGLARKNRRPRASCRKCLGSLGLWIAASLKNNSSVSSPPRFRAMPVGAIAKFRTRPAAVDAESRSGTPLALRRNMPARATCGDWFDLWAQSVPRGERLFAGDGTSACLGAGLSTPNGCTGIVFAR